MLPLVQQIKQLTVWFLPAMLLSLCACTSKDGDFNVFSPEEDVAMGARYDAEMLDQSSAYPILPENQYPEVYKRVRSMVENILNSDDILHRDEFKWEVKVLQDDSVLNAFCTPGGFIYVYTGLIKYLDSEDQLAGVLGHEIAHADLRHSSEQLTRNAGIKLVLMLILGDGSSLVDIAGNLAGLTFSRSDETEADLQSVRYLYDTDYDPRGVARFFEKMEAKGESLGPLVFLSTHPNPENRVLKIMEEWKKLGAQQGEERAASYNALKEMLP